MKMSLLSKAIFNAIAGIVENTEDLMFAKDKDFKYIASSKSFAVDCVNCDSAEEVLGKTDFELFSDNVVAKKYRDDDELLIASGKDMMEFDEWYPDKNGDLYLCKTTKYLIRDEEGNPLGIFGQYHDISEEVEREILRRKGLEKTSPKP